jgi:hypothetical protein
MRMSYSVAPAPAARTRPGVVTTASLLLYVSAVLLLVSVGVSLVPIGDVQKIIDEKYANEPENVRQAASIGAVVGPIVVGVVYLVIAVALVVLGILVSKGKQPARVITWVLAGLGVLCLGCGLAASGLNSSFSGLGGGGADQQELLDAIAGATPGWVTATGLVLQIISLLIMVTVIILLALPAANDYFRKEQQVWVPPTAPWPADPNNFPPPPPPGAKL